MPGVLVPTAPIPILMWGKDMAMDDVVAVILGGGRGTRLFPLTQHRSKPAVPIGGNYRLIDVAVSNCLHADVRRIFVLTQYQSESLNSHIGDTYKFDMFSSGFVEVLAAEQTEDSSEWFQGTADAVRQVARHLRPRVVRRAADPGRRPALPDGLPGHDAGPPRDEGRRHRGHQGGARRADRRRSAS